nr:denticleless protein homolog A-like [Ipomoea batatas]
MEGSRNQSFFQDIKSRELNGFRVKKRPFISSESAEFSEMGAVSVEHSGQTSPPMALSFCKTSSNCHIVALADEGGYVSLYNTRSKFLSSSTYQENAENAMISEWIAHDSAIFDICWIQEDSNIVTASGDQSIKVWDVKEQKCLRALMGHTGSVKSICVHPTNHNVIVSGSRDGSFALWDLRCNNSSGQRLCIPSIAMVHEAHISPCQRRGRRRKASSMSITSVLHLKDEVSIATAGAVDSVIKFWDTRSLKSPISQACPHPEGSAEKERKLHGISSLSQDLNGVFISASCMDSRIYLYNVLQLEQGPVKTFSGCRIDSFFVKSSISPDAAHILSGSSDGNAYIWQIRKPLADPIILNSHEGEVTAVDWCPSETGKIATASDDFTARIWNIQSSCYSNTRSPSSIRRRIMAPSGKECRKLNLFPDDKTDCPRNDLDVSYSPASEISTPESQKRKYSLLGYDEMKDKLEKTPESTERSPSSVLNPPSSLKRRTIRDYFLSAS